MTQEERNALQRWAEHHKALAADVSLSYRQLFLFITKLFKSV